MLLFIFAIYVDLQYVTCKENAVSCMFAFRFQTFHGYVL